VSRAAAFAFALLAYALFLAVFSYGIGFVGNLLVPKTIDSGPVEPTGRAVLVNLALLAIFAAPHSIMARAGFKRRWTRIVPPIAERSAYVFVSSLLFALVFWQWRPIPIVIASVDATVARWLLLGISLAGWGLVFVSTIYTGHFDLTGVRQAYLYWRGREYAPVPFSERGLYGRLRHPLMLGLLVAFWVTPHMTVGHLLFAAGMTAYILVGVSLEERDLARLIGDDYRRYRERVPMLFPRLRG
jgi:methanethiol S-methyltransferase